MLDIISANGNRKTFESAEQLVANTKFGIQKALYRTGKELIGSFNQQVLAKNKTGRLYIRKDSIGRRRRHIASAEGESPANRTGAYRRAVGFRVNGSDELIFGNSAEYSGFLELGTSRMKARPGLGNSVQENERNILRNLSGDIREAL